MEVADNGKPAEGRCKHIPVRRCVICGQRFSKHELTRYTLGNNNTLIMDESKKRQGRGWYCCANPLCKSKITVFRAAKKQKSGKVSGR